MRSPLQRAHTTGPGAGRGLARPSSPNMGTGGKVPAGSRAKRIGQAVVAVLPALNTWWDPCARIRQAIDFRHPIALRVTMHPARPNMHNKAGMAVIVLGLPATTVRAGARRTPDAWGHRVESVRAACAYVLSPGQTGSAIPAFSQRMTPSSSTMCTKKQRIIRLLAQRRADIPETTLGRRSDGWS